MRVFTSHKKWDSVAHKIDQMGDFKPEIVSEDSGVVELDPREDEVIFEINKADE